MHSFIGNHNDNGGYDYNVVALDDDAALYDYDGNDDDDGDFMNIIIIIIMTIPAFNGDYGTMHVFMTMVQVCSMYMILFCFFFFHFHLSSHYPPP